MGAGVLLFNNKNELLIVKPFYKDHWSIPGGVVDADESMRATVIRETREEIGLRLKNIKFICVDYTKEDTEKTEALQFIFYGGRLTPEQIKKIKIDQKEIIDYKFVNTRQVKNYLGGTKNHLAKRLPRCLQAIKSKTPVYLENGEIIKK